MADHLRFTKAGLMGYTWGSEIKQYTSKPIEPDEVLSSLRIACKIDPEVTLGDIFRTVAAYPALESFIGQYSWCGAIREFHAQALLPKKDDGELAYLEISKYVEADADADYQQLLDFGGIGAAGAEHPHYSVSMTPMNELAHLEVRLNETIEICGSTHTSWFSLLEILDAIYDDISFHGGPAQTAEFAEELEGMVKDVEAGTAKLIPWEPEKDTVN